MDGARTTSTGKFTLTFASGPTLGAHFHSTSGNRTDGPWPYTVEAGRTLSDTWSTSSSTGNQINLTVWGPNGFLRTWKGPAKKAGPEVTARHVAATGNLALTLANSGTTAVNLTVTNAYGGAPQTLRVAAGATGSHTVTLAASGQWYDVQVVSDADATFLRRFAGHVETGAAGISDPAIKTV
ncbi:phospholipase C, phosphocholine-specific [Streptomyces avidinii]